MDYYRFILNTSDSYITFSKEDTPNIELILYDSKDNELDSTESDDIYVNNTQQFYSQSNLAIYLSDAGIYYLEIVGSSTDYQTEYIITIECEASVLLG